MEVNVMNADGSGKRKLARISWNFGAPSWSPDGTKLLYERRLDPTRWKGQCGGCDVDVYVMNADGSGQRNLTRNPAFDNEPVWSPCGQKIAFLTSRDGNNEIYVMNTDGSGQRNLTRNPAGDGFPDWSPDGQKIGFTSNRGGNRDIYVMNADGSNQRNLTRDIDRQAFGIAWAPA